MLAAFKGHFNSRNQATISHRSMKTDEVVVHAGETPQLQKLYVVVNRLFKGYLKQLYSEWLFGEDHVLNPAGRIKKLSVAVCHWIITAWYDISPEVTVKNLQKYCISSTLDGTVDCVFGMSVKRLGMLAVSVKKLKIVALVMDI